MISMIAAAGENSAIGKSGNMPWHLPNDLKYFKRITTGHPVIMGRKTFDSIGRPLPNRRNIVITRNESFSPAGVEVYHSFDDLDKLMESKEEFFVIGGATIYEQMISRATRIYLTKIHESFEGDTFFPKMNEKEWKVTSTEKGNVDEKNRYEHTFFVYERIK